MAVSFIIAFILLVAVYLIVPKMKKKEKEEINAVTEAFKFESNTHSSFLIVNKKTPAADKSLYVHVNREVFKEEIPDKLVYTGATVGGVTTGGFHVQKGGTVYKSGEKTGTCSLIYKYPHIENDNTCHEDIDYLQLSDALMREAQASPILSKRIVTKEQREQYKNIHLTSSLEGRKNLISLAELGEGTARSIIEWLCGNNTNSSTTASNSKISVPPNTMHKMNKVFTSAKHETVVFGDNGITVQHTEIGVKHSNYYPYCQMTQFKAVVRIGIIINIKGVDAGGNEYKISLGFNPSGNEREKLKSAIDYAKKNCK